ncbi:MAG: thioredoxin [Bacteroidales bacterium]|nr:thioredoxin [Bacteroidales bacterium]
MKKISFIIALSAAFLFLGCTNMKGNQKQGQSEANKTETATTDIKPEQLTYNDFLTKVWNFEKNPREWVYEGDEPCVIDFYADWCGPCKRVAPIMDEMAKTYNGKVRFYKVNVDQQQKLAAVFRIQSIPAVLFIPEKGKPMMQVGLLPHDTYINIINEHLIKQQATK